MCRQTGPDVVPSAEAEARLPRPAALRVLALPGAARRHQGARVHVGALRPRLPRPAARPGQPARARHGAARRAPAVSDGCQSRAAPSVCYCLPQRDPCDDEMYVMEA